MSCFIHDANEWITAAEEVRITAERVENERWVERTRRQQKDKEAVMTQHQKARQQEQARRTDERQRQRARTQEQAHRAEAAKMVGHWMAFAHSKVNRRKEKAEQERQKAQEEYLAEDGGAPTEGPPQGGATAAEEGLG